MDSPSSHINSFNCVVPDGSNYLLVQPNLRVVPEVTLRTEFTDLLDYHRLSGQQIRLVYDAQDQLRLHNLLQELELPTQSELKTWDTNFFTASAAELLALRSDPALDWSQRKHFEYVLLSQQLPLAELPYINQVLDYMLTSFGVSFTSNGRTRDQGKQTLIQNQFPAAITNALNHIYLVRQKQEGSIVGCFTLVDKEGEHQVWLQSMAAISDSPRQYPGPGNLKLLISAVLDVLSQKYNFSKNLMFTCSKPRVREVYQSFGFKPNPNVQGLILSS